MYHPEVTYSTLYDYFKSYLNWDWLTPTPLNHVKLLSNKRNLPLAGYFNAERPAFISTLDKKNFKSFLNYFFSLNKQNKSVPALLVFSDNSQDSFLNQLSPSVLADINIPMLTTQKCTKTCLDALLPYCYQELSPRIIQHGTFIEVMGKGVLLTGKSGVGKSLTALYCLNNNHAFIADDAPFFYKHGIQLFGGSPTKLVNSLEIRNLGIIDVSKSYGPQFVRSIQKLDMIINLNRQPDEKRLINIASTTEDILGISIPKLPLPFTENIAILIENAVRCLYTNQIHNS
tara:strand:- start:11368 stop:12228 length:861 start_codon:yes stop_codon:yes gene_type:complete